jgi:hypothetical protein
VLDASGHEVILDGGNALRLIEVLTNLPLGSALDYVTEVGRDPRRTTGKAAVLLDGGSMSVSNRASRKNLATSQKFEKLLAAGGAIYVSYSTLSLVDCRFSAIRPSARRDRCRATATPWERPGWRALSAPGITRLVRTRFDSNLAEGGRSRTSHFNGAGYGAKSIFIETGDSRNHDAGRLSIRQQHRPGGQCRQ